ncbi:MAG: hypothetical protein P4L42_06730 [Desulfocapsaceae bacterium]|nr:hypothetical protein [Desulfocapsaceae bacterium]
MNTMKGHAEALKQLYKIDRQDNAMIRSAVNALAGCPIARE